jgi:hypothetical protein
LTVTIGVCTVDVTFAWTAIKPVFANNRRVHLVDWDHQAFVKDITLPFPVLTFRHGVFAIGDNTPMELCDVIKAFAFQPAGELLATNPPGAIRHDPFAFQQGLVVVDPFGQFSKVMNVGFDCALEMTNMVLALLNLQGETVGA